MAEVERVLKKTSQCKPSQKSLQGESGGGRKVGIPRLKLEVLPNYHKKS